MRKSLIFLLAAFLLAGCGLFSGETPAPGPTPTLPDPAVTRVSAPDPEITAAEYLEAWNARDFDSMYALLSPLSQDGLSREAFMERYEDVGKAMALTGVEFEIVSSLVNPDEAQVRYRINLQSAVVGDIIRETWMDLRRNDDAWRIVWSPTNILPELDDEHGLLLVPVVPTRANIYDRNGLALATPADTVALWIVPNEIGGKEAEGTMLSVLSRLLGWPQENIQALYDDIRDTNWYVHLGEVSLEQLSPYQNTLASVGGVNWRIYESRYYVGGGLAPHATGYVSWIPEDEVDEYVRKGYQVDAFVGQMGLEYVYEEQLRGTPGGTLYLTDAEGQLGESLASRPSEPPQAVYTNLDRDLQRYAQQAIQGFTGAIVVLERDTGAVLALASSPGFDPNFFDPNHPYSGGGLGEIFGDTNRPLFNRATSGEYPLGSVFKIITTAAALETEFYDPDTIYNCGSEFTDLPGITLYDWTYEKGYPPQGEISLQEALVRSCNPYFYHIGLDLYEKELPTALPEMARGFGLGEPTGIEIGDQAGLVPDPENKQELFGEEWGPQDAVNLAIGQSYLQVTPLQVARYVAAIGNGGALYRPQLVNRIQTAEGEVVQSFEPEVQGQLPISRETLLAIQEAMVDVVRATKGTARGKFLGLNLDVAGKTGTATTGDFSEAHAWFAGYTFEEREDVPDIAVVVLAEYEGEGSDWAAPIFRRIVEAYFFGQPYTPYPWEARIGVVKTATPTPSPEDLEATGTPTPEG